MASVQRTRSESQKATETLGEEFVQELMDELGHAYYDARVTSVGEVPEAQLLDLQDDEFQDAEGGAPVQEDLLLERSVASPEGQAQSSQQELSPAAQEAQPMEQEAVQPVQPASQTYRTRSGRAILPPKRFF